MEKRSTNLSQPAATADTLYGYYVQQRILPTHGGFSSPRDLVAHEEHRRSLFTDKLKLPPMLFRGARLLEFGPDAGENSLVFARWGADCTLAEPNPKAHVFIRDYFEMFGQTKHLTELRPEDVLTFPVPTTAAEQFDVVDAEGFIYTVQPSSLWIDKLARLTRPEGFVVLFYIEAFGSFMEFMLKVVHSHYCRITGTPAQEAAAKLYRAKWDSIPHKRKMESWTMDVLENPFVRLQYCLEPQTLCRETAKAGFRLYSSWPAYGDVLDVHWFKKTLSEGAYLQQQMEFIERSRLSHLFGRKHFLLKRDPALERRLSQLLELVDSMIVKLDESSATRCANYLAELGSLLNSDAVLSEAADRQASLETIRSYQKLLKVLVGNSPNELVEFCNSDQGFINSWGMPSHFAVYRKT